jgi:hypothetical protein
MMLEQALTNELQFLIGQNRRQGFHLGGKDSPGLPNASIRRKPKCEPKMVSLSNSSQRGGGIRIENSSPTITGNVMLQIPARIKKPADIGERHATQFFKESGVFGRQTSGADGQDLGRDFRGVA